MAYLSNLTSQELFPLAAHHTFGRLAASVNTYIDSPCISRLHAAIEWNGRNWCIKNLGLNGTWLNEGLLEAGDMPELALNDHIRLAEQSDPGFRVLDLTPPTDMLWPMDVKHPQPIYLSRYHLLPDAAAPEAPGVPVPAEGAAGGRGRRRRPRATRPAGRCSRRR